MTSYTACRSLSLTVFLAIAFAAMASEEADPKQPQIKNLRDVINSKYYPSKLKDNPIEGKVVVSIWLNEDGEILKFKVEESNNEDLEEYILGRVPLLEFEPARNEFGARTYSKVKLPFEFKKDESAALAGI